MDTETSSFETSEMLATFLASTPLLSESWRLCNLANTNSPQGFVAEQIGSIGYVAFSGIQSVSGSDPSFKKLVPLPDVGNSMFHPLHRQTEGEEPVLVQGALLRIFEDIYKDPSFQSQMQTLMQTSKSIIFTGHSVGGATASLAALWLLSYLQSNYLNLSVLCITFGSPLLGNETLSRSILREKWGGKFCHVVSKYDIMPRMLFVPMDPIAPLMKPLLHFWHTYMNSPHFGLLDVPLSDDSMAQIFHHVLFHLERVVKAGEEAVTGMLRPFGNYFFCSEDGAICVDNAASVVKMMYLLFATTGLPSSSIGDHLMYGDYVGKISLQFLEKRSFMQGELPESSYEAGVALALQSTGISCKDPIAGQAKDCLKAARRLGRTPNLNCANLAIKLSKINPYRAEIEWYKALCDRSDDQMGYYDSFKQRGASRRDFRVNLNRHKLAQFWDNVINLFESNQLPHDFHRQGKWVNASQFYKLLVEPLDIAEYYRTGMHRSKGHYIEHGRERRYRIFDRWWKERSVREEGYKRSKFASLTQDTCFWARVEQARDLLDALRSTSDPSHLALLWEKIDCFASYANALVEAKEVSIDVVAKNSSYSLWLKDYNELKSQMVQFRPLFLSFVNEEMVP
ncbi:hypothetical protein NC652_013183 [Populus alba x Populus x berolinensis]|nr:hypothetical protein NC652_013183 [Populus alba x Populus x berolinensis]